MQVFIVIFAVTSGVPVAGSVLQLAASVLANVMLGGGQWVATEHLWYFYIE
jgi:hypothetical protein